MGETIVNLSSALMTVQLTHLHVNSYFMSKVYFGWGVMELSDEQDKELSKTHENPLAINLGSGSNFSRKMFHGRLKAMGVWIVAIKTNIAALLLKLHLSHRQMKL